MQNILVYQPERLTNLANSLLIFVADDVAKQEIIQRDFESKTDFVKQLAISINMSDFLYQTLNQQPNLLYNWWLKSPVLSDVDNYALQLKHNLSTNLSALESEDELYQQLRIVRNQELARLTWLQALNLSSVEDIFIKLSELAEALINAAKDWLYLRLCAKYGTPVNEQGDEQQLIILAMGKLGGFELNFSSDVDLIFTYPENGETQAKGRGITNEQFFTRLGQQLIRALSSQTVDGFVYRVDMRLRPFGDSGSLVLSFAAMEDYYQEQGRDWERYAMVKARILDFKSDDSQHQLLIKLLRPFIYRHYIDFSVLQSLRSMKQKITREVRQRGLEDNIKLGAGGIREIEFSIQVMQLIHAGHNIRLQNYSILKVLPVLAEMQLFSSEQIEVLLTSYLFLRRIENVLQSIADQQTQVLPTLEIDKQRLVYACQEYIIWDANQQPILVHQPIRNWQDFLTVLQNHKQQVRDIFNDLIAESTATNSVTPEIDSVWCDFLQSHLDKEEILQLTIDANLAEDNREQITEFLFNFQHEIEHKHIGTRGRKVLIKLMPFILLTVFKQQEYLTVLPRILNLLTKIVTRTAYLELLFENKNIFQKIITIFSASPMLADKVASYPILLDELLDYKSSFQFYNLAQYHADLHQFLLRIPEDDEELLINKLREFKQIHLFRVGAADILNILPVMQVSDQLTFLAEAIINMVINIAWKQTEARYGRPDHLVDGQKKFMLVGYGKLGGIELGYRSDLDIVFIYDCPAESMTVGAQRSIASSQFYSRLSQKIINIFSLNTNVGTLYDIDTRLRPSGNSGLLVTSIAAFADYQYTQAWIWEKQALVRARVISADEDLGTQFDSIRHNAISAKFDPIQLKQEIIAMRIKMHEHLANPKAGYFDIKLDRGGITDIEFIAQYLILANAHKLPELTRWSDNVRIFEDLAKFGVIQTQDALKLIDIYTKLRNQIHHLNLACKTAVVDDELFKTEREYILNYWQKLFA